MGKSTLFNKLVGQRLAIVDENPGTTRDRLYGTAEWSGRVFTLVDTGGLTFEDVNDVDQGILAQAQEAMERATGILFMVDAKEGRSAVDCEVADLLRTTPEGQGVVSCLELAGVQDQPRLCPTFLMWLLAEL